MVELALLIAGLATGTGLLIVLHRAGVGKRLPWFTGYAWWVFLETTVGLMIWAFHFRWYAEAFWWMEVVEVALIVASVRESFLRIFRGFTTRPGFRRAVLAVIAAVVAYSGWKAVYAPPVVGNRLTAFVLDAEFLFRWGIAGIGLLTIVLTWLLGASSKTHEDAVVTGFTLVSGAFVANIVLVSLFGTKYFFVSRYLPSVGYFIAAFLWIRVFTQPEHGAGFEELGIGPEEMLRTMRSYRQGVRRIRGS